MKKPLHWIGSSRESVKEFPKEVRAEVGFALHAAQLGLPLVSSVALYGFGSAKVVEQIVDHDGDTFRSVYTVKFRNAVYVLHAFKKKSTNGIKTQQRDMELIRKRLRVAEEHYNEHYIRIEKRAQSNDQGP